MAALGVFGKLPSFEELENPENNLATEVISIDGETLGFRMEEKTRREPYQPTPAEQKKLDENRYYRYRLPDDKFVPTGRLCLKLETGYGSGLRSSWADGKKQRIEYCLNKFIAAAYQAAAYQKAKRLEREREERARRERERQLAILRRQIEHEQARLDLLNEQAKAWQEAQQLREYVYAVRRTGYYARQTITGGRDMDEWCTSKMTAALKYWKLFFLTLLVHPDTPVVVRFLLPDAFPDQKHAVFRTSGRFWIACASDRRPARV